jgi:hypothetical protein
VNAIRAALETRDDASLPAAVAAFAREPFGARFGAIHIVGESFAERKDSMQKLPIPDWVPRAHTLATIAELYMRPVADVLAFNPGWGPRDALAAGTVVRVPDPDFAPWMAAHLAADVLASPPLSSGRRAQLIRMLAPAGSRDPTSLDLVLARLLLAASPSDTTLLDELSAIVARYLTTEVLAPAPRHNPALPA